MKEEEIGCLHTDGPACRDCLVMEIQQLRTERDSRRREHEQLQHEHESLRQSMHEWFKAVQESVELMEDPGSLFNHNLDELRKADQRNMELESMVARLEGLIEPQTPGALVRKLLAHDEEMRKSTIKECADVAHEVDTVAGDAVRALLDEVHG